MRAHVHHILVRLHVSNNKATMTFCRPTKRLGTVRQSLLPYQRIGPNAQGMKREQSSPKMSHAPRRQVPIALSMCYMEKVSEASCSLCNHAMHRLCTSKAHAWV